MKTQAEFESLGLKVSGQEPSFGRVACLYAAAAESALASVPLDSGMKARKLPNLTPLSLFVVGGSGDCSEPQKSRKQVAVALQEGLLLASGVSEGQPWH